MNCFLQPMYSFRIGGGALKDYMLGHIIFKSSQREAKTKLNVI